MSLLCLLRLEYGATFLPHGSFIRRSRRCPGLTLLQISAGVERAGWGLPCRLPRIVSAWGIAMMLCQERAVSCIIPAQRQRNGQRSSAEKGMHIPYPALITVLQSLPHVPHHLLIYVTSIQPRGLLEVGEFGFVLQELDESGRRLRKDLSSAPILLLMLANSPRETPSNPHRHNTHTPC